MKKTTVTALAVATVLFVSGCGNDPEKPGAAGKQDVKATSNAPNTSAAPVTSPTSASAPAPGPAASPADDFNPKAMPPKDLASMCEQCHDKADVARYKESFLPVYTMMFRPAPWTDPNVYSNAMRPVMDPETYTRWYNQWARITGAPVNRAE